MGWNGLFGSKSERVSTPWKHLNGPDQLDGIVTDSATRPQLIFKHSTRCSISSMALERFEREWDPATTCDIWLLDLLQHRDISNAIAQRTGVMHQSPQAILLVGGDAVYDASHSAISAREVMDRSVR
jgi:bacillithiol system protein YtxJ